MSSKRWQEVRDPVHEFLRFDEHEKVLIGSRPFQRLRSIRQLAMTYLVYPGASHTRFEHSLGVMELAGRAFDTITNDKNILCDQAKDIIYGEGDALPTLRNCIRYAALCHDLGHLPFSHAAEKDLLPNEHSHEDISLKLIVDSEVTESLEKARVHPETVARLALGPKKYKKATGSDLTPIESILSELITGDAFGVDRMDYLLRDSYHCGVPYGRFDHFLLLDNLRLLHDEGGKPAIGVNEGALLTTDGMLLSRNFMYQTVYSHPVRKIYDRHLVDFLSEWLPNGNYPTDVEEHLALTDDEVMSALRSATRSKEEPGYEHASRILGRKHFKRVKFSTPEPCSYKRLDLAKGLQSILEKEFGRNFVRRVEWQDGGQSISFPVLDAGGRIKQSSAFPSLGQQMPIVALHEVFVDRAVWDRASSLVGDEFKKWEAGQDSELLSILEQS